MRKVIKEIELRHQRQHEGFGVDEFDEDYFIDKADDVPLQEWYFVHQDRQVLLDEIHRLYGLLRRRRAGG